MSLSSVIPLAATLAPLARHAVQQLTDGLSFAEVLRGREQPAESAGERAATVERSAGLPSVEHLQRLGAQQLEQLLEKLQRHLAAENLSLGEPLELKSDGQGGVLVANGHFDRAAIEDLFVRHPELAHDFHRVAAAFAAERRLLEGRPGAVRDEFVLRIVGNEAGVTFV